MPPSLLPVLILYGSQTGNAEAIAKELCGDLASILPSSSLQLSSMSDFVKGDDSLSSLPSFPLLLFVLSTTGQGDPPDNAAKFLRVLRKRLPQPSSSAARFLSSSAFAVLALGDTNYTNFCKPGVRLDEELGKMGGERWIKLACADDGTNLQAVVEPWKAQVIEKLRAHAPQPARGGEGAAAAPQPSVAAASSSPAISAPVAAHAQVFSGLYKPSATASAIQQAQQAIRALQLARSIASQAPSIQAVLSAQSSSASSSAAASSSRLPLPPCLILFATQTGNSEAIARELHAMHSYRFSPPATLLSMAQFLSAHSSSILPLASFPLLVIVISSTGQGDPPDNAVRFIRALKTQSDADRHWLQGTRYVVLGLGDTNYDTFGAASERVEKEVHKGGARRLMVREVADDAVGLAVLVEPWKTKWIHKMEELAAEDKAAEHKHEEKLPGTRSSILPASEKAAHAESGEEWQRNKQLPAATPPSVILPVLSKAAEEPCDAAGCDPASRRPKVKVAKPIGLARFHPARIAVQTSSPSRSSSPSSPSLLSSSSYFTRRWQAVDTEAVLRGYTPDAPFFVRLSSARYLTTPKAHEQGRRVIHVELEMSRMSSETVLYTPGDSIGCYCVNDCALVQQLADRLGLHMDDLVEIKANEAIDVEGMGAKEKENKEPPIVHSAAPSPSARSQTSSPLPSPPLSAPAAPSSTGLSHILSPCSVSDVFIYCVDVATQPKKTFLRMLAEFCHDEEDKARLYHLASHGGKKDYDALIQSRAHSLLELLTRFPSCHPPLAHLLDQLPALQPRYYSITSSPTVHPSSIHVAYTLVPNGVCTTWLTQLCQHAGFLQDGFVVRQEQPLLGVQSSGSSPSSPAVSLSIPIFMRRTQTFTLPPSLSTPLILVGPGTGAAPYRSFLFQRRCQRAALASGGVAMGMWRGLDLDMEGDAEEDSLPLPAGYVDRFRRAPTPPKRPVPASQLASSSLSSTPVGDVLLFLGCRAADQDFLYQEDFASFLADQTLTSLIPAFSREGPSKVYVQDRLRAHGQRVYELLERGAVLFVCGDGGAMARGVMRALQDVLVEHGGIIDKAALDRVAQLMKDKRYVQDVWSA